MTAESFCPKTSALSLVSDALALDTDTFRTSLQQAEIDIRPMAGSLAAMRNFASAIDDHKRILNTSHPHSPNHIVPWPIRASVLCVFAEHLPLMARCAFKPSLIAMNTAVTGLRKQQPPISWRRMYEIAGLVMDGVNRKIDHGLISWQPMNHRRLLLDRQYAEALHLSTRLPSTCSAYRIAA